MARKTILIVEPQTSTRNLLSYLFSQKGYLVYETSDGNEAMGLFLKAQPHVILCEREIAEYSGLDLLKSVKKINPSVPFVLTSLPGDQSFILEALRCKADLYFLKPLKYPEVLEGIDQITTGLSEWTQREHECLKVIEHSMETTLLSRDLQVPLLVENLAKTLPSYYTLEETRTLRLGLEEALTNALEHGNLEISDTEKAAALSVGEYENLYHLRMEKHGEKKIRLSMRLTQNSLVFIISDEGKGFNWKKHLNPSQGSPSESFQGRGLVLLRAFFDEISFEGAGNVLKLLKKIPLPRHAAQIR